VLASAVSPTQDLPAFLWVLYAAVDRYGSPAALVTDGGSVFRANQARAIYEALGIHKEEIERGRPWQSYVETTFNIQRRMADWHFGRAGSWPELVAAHNAWVEDYNAQVHWAHRGRADGRRSPEEVLGWLAGVRYRDEDLERAFFSTRSSRKLDALGYVRFLDWRLYGEEGLAGKEAAVWLQEKSLTLEYRGEPLSRYDVEYVRGTDRLEEVGRPRLYQTPHDPLQPKLFRLDILGETGWLKALRLEGYAPRHPRRSLALQEALFPYLDALA
jgi:hypothetical protein